MPTTTDPRPALTLVLAPGEEARLARERHVERLEADVLAAARRMGHTRQRRDALLARTGRLGVTRDAKDAVEEAGQAALDLDQAVKALLAFEARQ